MEKVAMETWRAPKINAEEGENRKRELPSLLKPKQSQFWNEKTKQEATTETVDKPEPKPRRKAAVSALAAIIGKPVEACHMSTLSKVEALPSKVLNKLLEILSSMMMTTMTMFPPSPEVFTFKIADIIPPYHTRKIYYSSPDFKTANNQLWKLMLRVTSTGDLECYLTYRPPLLLSSDECTVFTINEEKTMCMFTSTTNTKFGFNKILSTQTAGWRDRYLTLTLSTTLINPRHRTPNMPHRNLALLNNKALSDVAFKVGRKVVYALSPLLVAHTTYFKSLLSSQFKESAFDKSKPIALEGVTFPAVLNCFEWIYTGDMREKRPTGPKRGAKLRLAEEMLETYVAADLFLLEGLREVVEGYLEREVVDGSCFGTILVFGHARGLRASLLRKAAQFWREANQQIQNAKGATDNEATVVGGGENASSAPKNGKKKKLVRCLVEMEDRKTQSGLIRDYMTKLSEDEFNELLGYAMADQ
ncbi:hypothetical protein HDV05_002387 [Chytridiales sp. JEL 0842]|nr:hypothetical protein HDV05_002387 [Chytridiales sp. JEL 0842]